MPQLRVVITIVLALSLASCSFVFTRGPGGETPPRTYPRCTTSMTWPIVDGVFSALFLTAMVSAIAEDEPAMSSSDDDEATKAQKITSAALFAAATGIGAFVGYRRVSGCRVAHERFLAQYPYGMPYGGYPYGAYPQPYPAQGYPQPYPGQQPQPAQPTPTAPATPTSSPPVPALGTEGDVCASSEECATGLTCTSNVCVRPPAAR